MNRNRVKKVKQKGSDRDTNQMRWDAVRQLEGREGLSWDIH